MPKGLLAAATKVYQLPFVGQLKQPPQRDYLSKSPLLSSTCFIVTKTATLKKAYIYYSPYHPRNYQNALAR